MCNSRLIVRQYCQGAFKKTILSEEKENAANTKKPNIAIRHPAQQRITRAHTAASSTTKYYVRDAWRPYCLLPVHVDTKQLVEQQSIELIDSMKRRRLRECSKFSSSKQQHNIQVHIIRKLRWHETSAETPYKCQLRDGTRTASEADGSVFQL